jgi:hypothetical protein
MLTSELVDVAVTLMVGAFTASNLTELTPADGAPIVTSLSVLTHPDGVCSCKNRMALISLGRCVKLSWLRDKYSV